jgi:hypothetical protein
MQKLYRYCWLARYILAFNVSGYRTRTHNCVGAGLQSPIEYTRHSYMFIYTWLIFTLPSQLCLNISYGLLPLLITILGAYLLALTNVKESLSSPTNNPGSTQGRGLSGHSITSLSASQETDFCEKPGISVATSWPISENTYWVLLEFLSELTVTWSPKVGIVK